MKQAHRFLYYFSGFSIGVVFLVFFFSGKKTTCAYGMDARTLKSIRVLKRSYGDSAKLFFANSQIDTTSIAHILKNGDVDFSKSQTERDSCNVYFVYGDFKGEKLGMSIERCDSIATVKKIVELD